MSFDEPNAKRARREDAPEVMCGFKALCPDNLVAALIGKDGATRKQIEEESGATVRMSKRDEFFPGSRCRIVTVMGAGQDEVLAALDRILGHVVACAEEEREKGGPKGKGKMQEESLLGKEGGEYIFRLSLPKVCTGNLIGPGGERIKKMREELGAKVFVENDSHSGNQSVRIIGSQDPILQTLAQMLEIIQTELAPDRMTAWTSMPMFDVTGKGDKGDKGKGGGKKGKHEDGGGGGKYGGKTDDRHHGRDNHDMHYNDEPRGHNQSRQQLPEDHSERSVDAIRMLMSEFPDGCLDMDYQVTCELPSERVGGLIGRKGQGVRDVEQSTNCKVSFQESRKGEEQATRTMNIVGPLISVYTAHMLMMKKYHEGVEREEREAREREEREREEQERHYDDRRGGGGDQVSDLKAQLEALQGKLQAIEGGGSKGGNARKGGGKGKR